MKMCSAFASHGHDVVLYARAGHRTNLNVFEYYGCAAAFDICLPTRVKDGIVGKLLHPLKVASHVKHESSHPDLLYGRHLYSLVALARSGFPMVYEAHTLPRSSVDRHLQAWMFRLKNFRRLVVISEALRRDYRTSYPWLDDVDVIVAHDGAQLPESEPPLAPVSTGRPRLGYIGSLYPGKGMEIISEISARLPEFEIHIFGGSDTEIERWRRYFSDANIRFHGFIPHGKLETAYQFFDIALAPFQKNVATQVGTDDISRWTSPLKIFEYMAHRKPIICSSLPVLREILRHRENALLVGPEDPEQWVSAIRLLEETPILAAQLAAAARRDVAARYLWQHRAVSVIAGIAQD